MKPIGPKSLRKTANALTLAHEVAQRAVDVEAGVLEDLETERTARQEARSVVTNIAQQVQENAHQQIAAVVTSALEAVFDDPYEFVIRFERKRNRTEAVLEFTRDDNPVNPLEAAGGGVVDVAAFALRVACMTLSKPRIRSLLVLDEPFRFVSRNYRERLRDLIQTLSERLEIQFVIVTHIDELELGKVVRLSDA